MAIDSLSCFLNSLVVSESAWKFVTSGGAALEISTPVVEIGANATAGVLHVRNGNGPVVKLVYGGIGGSLGLSAIPSPANLSFSLPAMPSTGLVYRLPFACGSVSRSELSGAMVLFELSADAYATGSAYLMFVGGSTLAGMVASVATIGMGTLPMLLATSNAVVPFCGVGYTVVPLNVSVTGYVGLIG